MSDSHFSFIANSQVSIEAMLKDLKLNSLEELFKDIPDHLIINKKPHFSLPDPHSELETKKRLQHLAKKNIVSDDVDVFIGSGTYNHYVPTAVSEIANRAEFKTAYTPYAPELSQGMLTALYEYQSMICELTGLEIANTSMYDWSTALVEAALMCMRIKKGGEKPVFLVSRAMHKDRLMTLETYAKPLGLSIQTISYNNEGQIDVKTLESLLSEHVIGTYIESPNLFGLIEPNIKQLINSCHNKDVLVVMGIDPISLAVLESPGNLGADICVGEAHHLGNFQNFGGPGLGILTSRNVKVNIRNMPGRIIGYTSTKDKSRDAYVMTLQTREQHIRREKATSNICTNEALFSVSAASYIAIMGQNGLTTLGKDLLGKINYLTEQINAKNLSIKVPYQGIYFKEAFISIPKGEYTALKDFLMKKNILIGPNLVDYSHLALDSDGFIFSVSEQHSKKQLDNFVNQLEKFEKEGV